MDSMWYVYFLKCGDERTYLGCCKDLRKRLDRHKNGNVVATKNRLQVDLIAYFAFKNRYIAYNFEKYLKSSSGRVFITKHQLMSQDCGDL